MFAKACADAIEGNWIDAGIGVGKDEANTPQSVQVAVEIFHSVRVEGKPQYITKR